METWYKVSLSEADISAGKGHALQNAFAALLAAKSAPADAAMFEKVDNRPPYVCFFTPGAFRIAEFLLRSYGAIPCEKPIGHQVVLLAGHSDAMKVFFHSTS
jgi:hypothetical protein